MYILERIIDDRVVKRMPTSKKRKVYGNRVEEEDTDSISEDENFEDPVISKKSEITLGKNKSDQWIDKYRPKRSSEICIHPRKLKDVRDTLAGIIQKKSSIRLLVLTGPAGSSKSTSVKLLAEELIEHDNVNTLDTYADDSCSSKFIEYFEPGIIDTSHSSQFKEFLSAARYRIKSNTAVILIEDLPNVYHRETLNKFRSLINEWINLDCDLPPLVFCISEVEAVTERQNQEFFNIDNSFTAETILGKEILSQSSKVKQIHFNPIAVSFIKKTLMLIANKECLNVKSSKNGLDQLISNASMSGDIRSAISSLQFWALNHRETNANYVRENQLGLFHALGKIMYSSGKFQGLNDDLTDYLSIEEVLGEYRNDSLLSLSILENYSLVNELNYDIRLGAIIADNLSLNDIMYKFNENNEFAVRGTRVQLRKIKDKKSQKSNFKFPVHFKILSEQAKSRREIDTYRKLLKYSGVSFQNLNLIDGCYVPMIYNLQSRQRNAYKRIGGFFKDMYFDDNAESPITNLDTSGSFYDNKLLDKLNQENTTDKIESDEMSDPIESDINSDDDIFNDSIDNSHINKLVGVSRSQTQDKSTDDDDFLSDPELDGIIKSGVF